MNIFNINIFYSFEKPIFELYDYSLIKGSFEDFSKRNNGKQILKKMELF